ncbi:hypothetical protein [Arthrobacter sp. Helios]|uniref:hypothetical protein n=1 Tax=Arthrobacter sp. Helios TaxID=2828862 RepID=UPI00205353AC|nr:hypothetical protein [Arthrobacter sp. Helios]UPO76353.1 hypothetical protein ArtHe_13490 [Arthrobacter sp. Helios]
MPLVGFVVIEPSRTHDRVGIAAGPDEPFTAQLPLGVGETGAGDADGCHEGNADPAAVQGTEDVGDAGIVVIPDVVFIGGGSMGEDDGVDTLHRRAQGLREGQVPDG